MSGIAGIIHFDGRPVAPGLVERMTDTIRHRGPDGVAHWVRGSVALGQCMLRTTSESLEETQPLTNEDESLVLVMDGRVDNWEELRVELLAKGARLRTRADAELVLRAYETWGRDCLPHIDGDFALVIWDARRREAFCARDRLGNKPFTYHWSGSTLAFASELRPLLDLPWVPKVINEGMIAELLSWTACSRDETPWRGVSRLVAAHSLAADARGPRIVRYWRPSLANPAPYRRDEEYFEHYRAMLADCVRRTSRSHRPVGYEVSGGLDSSAVFAVAADLATRGALPAPAIQAYTLAFQGPGAANELAYARDVARHVGRPVREVAPTRHPLAWFAERARREHDFPGYPNAAMFTGLRERLAADGGRVVIGGEGGDQWLAGSPAYYAEALASGQLGAAYRSFLADRADLGLAAAGRAVLRHGLVELLPRDVRDGLLQRIRDWRGVTDDLRYRRSWLTPRMRGLVLQRLAARPKPTRLPRRLAGREALLEMLDEPFADHVNEQAERSSSHAGLEARNPMLTAPFVQFAVSTPERLRQRGDISKFIHVRALAGLLPESVLQRRDKAEFSVVFREHLDRMLPSDLAEIATGEAAWLTPEGSDLLLRHYTTYPHLGWPTWALWGCFGCACLARV